MYIHVYVFAYIYTRTYKQIYFKELAYAIMGAGKSQIHRAGQ